MNLKSHVISPNKSSSNTSIISTASTRQSVTVRSTPTAFSASSHHGNAKGSTEKPGLNRVQGECHWHHRSLASYGVGLTIPTLWTRGKKVSYLLVFPLNQTKSLIFYSFARQSTAQNLYRILTATITFDKIEMKPEASVST